MHYRRIYEQYYGSIPRDENNRPFDIHHKDGDRTNDDISNLEALSLPDHYDRHWTQGDIGAALAIAQRMKKTHNELSYLARQHALKRVKEGTNPFQRRPDGTSMASDQVVKGINPFQRRSDGSSLSSDRVAKGNHPFLDKKATGNRSRGRKWWNNGSINKFTKECPGDNFIRGKL